MAAICCVATGTQAQLVCVDITVVCVTYTKMSSNMQRKTCQNKLKLSHFFPVPLPRVGHCDTRSQESDQPDADGEPGQTYQVGGGP